MNNRNKEPTPYEQVQEIEHALDYASRYFRSHAEQRLKTFRYFLAYILVLSVGLYKVLMDCHYGFLFFATLAGLAITCVFYCLERRNRELVENASLACIELEEELIVRLPKKDNGMGDPFKHVNIVQTAAKNKKWYFYRYMIRALFWMVFILQGVLLLTSFSAWLHHEFKAKCFPDIFEVVKEGCDNSHKESLPLKK